MTYEQKGSHAMRILCDTNIILAVLLDREGFADTAANVLQLCETGIIEGFTTASCMTDIFYLVHKQLHDNERSYQAIEQLLTVVRIADVTSGHIEEALSHRASDFEDCLAAVCAKSIHCDCIVTRDEKGFANFGLPVLTPADFIKRMI